MKKTIALCLFCCTPAVILAGPATLQANQLLGTSENAGQCLDLSLGSEDFGGINENSWRQWLGSSSLAFATNPQMLAQETTDDGRRSLRQKLVPSSKGSSRVMARASLQPASTYQLKQSIYLEDGFDWGGKHEGGKLGFGLSGGSSPTGGHQRTDGFSTRFMWRGNGDGSAHIAVYTYSADRTNQAYGTDLPLKGFSVPVGEWFELTLEVKVNSATDRADGSVRAWANGDLYLEENDILWQSSGGDPSVQHLMFSTFYGGSDSSWSPDETTYIRFADICWAPVVDTEEF
ncbi:MAG: hypothetical protein V3U76_15005 [Granulosicoccus sp.]